MDLGPLVSFLVLVLFIGAVYQARRRRRLRPGPGASGAIYDLLNEDKRKAVEIIVEERAGARDAENDDGDLPQLETPRR